MHFQTRLAVLTVVLAVVSACSGANPPPVPAAPNVTITSHAASQNVFGLRDIVVQGTLEDVDTIETVTLTVNGLTVPVTFDATSFSAAISLGDNANDILVTATDSTGLTGNASASLSYPYKQLTTFENADLVLGQADFASAGFAGPDAIHVISPRGAPTEVAGVLYVADSVNSRVLGFTPLPTTNGASASFVLGQLTFTGDSPGVSAAAFDSPTDVHASEGRLLVVDGDNSRILLYNTLPTTTAASADVAVGQPDLNTTGAGCSATQLDAPQFAFLVSGKLIVSDLYNNRVLVYSTVPTAHGAAADLVLGQGDFTHCTTNDDNQDGVEDPAPSARTMHRPMGVWSDGTRLVVADDRNHRVLVWNTFPTSHFQQADLVLGQAGFTTAAASAGASGLNRPNGVTSNGNQLLVADTFNNRVLIWNTFPTVSNAPATTVLGQSDFVHVTYADDNQDNIAEAVSARTVAPQGIRLVGDTLWVADGASRFLRY